MDERLSKVINNRFTIPVSVGVVTLGVGVGIGYILGRQNKAKAVIASNQLAFDFDTYKLGSKPNVFDTYESGSDTPLQEIKARPEYKTIDGRVVKVVNDIPEDPTLNYPGTSIMVGEHFAASKLKEVEEEIEEEGNEKAAQKDAQEVTQEDVQEVVTHSIFAGNDDEWNYAVEIRKRNTKEPCVIHKDEFFTDEKGYAQSTLTYYSGDDILVDEDDTPIYNHADVTGPLLFGHGSGDSNVVYIRNDKRKAEYEILRDPGLYSVEVLGLSIEKNDRVKELKHSKNMRFRQTE